MKPPPPGPATNGMVTPSALAVATAASMALPPRFSTAMPASLAFRSMDATAPPVPTATACFVTLGPRDGAALAEAPDGAALAEGRDGAALAADGRAASAAATVSATQTGRERRRMATSENAQRTAQY